MMEEQINYSVQRSSAAPVPILVKDEPEWKEEMILFTKAVLLVSVLQMVLIDEM